MSIGAILRAKREELGLTQEEVCQRSGVSKPYLSAIETGRAIHPPGEDKLRGLETALNFAPEQLVRIARFERTPKDLQDEMERLRAENRKFRSLLAGTAQGAALRKAAKATKEAEGAEAAAAGAAGKPAPTRVDAGKWVPVINRLAAGYPVWNGDLDYPPGVADDYVRCPDCHDPNAFAARVAGDSMEPRYREGDIVIFSPSAAVADGDDCFVRRTDTHETTFKRIFTEPEGLIRLQPRNEKYAPQTLPREQIDGLYKAVFRVERL